jgi:hypothetical protein
LAAQLDPPGAFTIGEPQVVRKSTDEQTIIQPWRPSFHELATLMANDRPAQGQSEDFLPKHRHFTH